MSKKARPRIYNRAGQRVPVQDKTWYAVQASGEASERVIEVFVYGEPIRANTVLVRFADLNLRTARDQIRLHHRVGGAIERVCDIDLGRDGLQDRGYYACTNRAWGGAAPQISNAIVRSRYAAHYRGTSIAAAAIVIRGR